MMPRVREMSRETEVRIMWKMRSFLAGTFAEVPLSGLRSILHAEGYTTSNPQDGTGFYETPGDLLFRDYCWMDVGQDGAQGVVSTLVVEWCKSKPEDEWTVSAHFELDGGG